MKPISFQLLRRQRWPYRPLQKGSSIGLSWASILVCVNQSQRCHNPKFGVSGSIPIPERKRERWVGAVECKCLTNETKACSSSVNILEESYQWKASQPTKPNPHTKSFCFTHFYQYRRRHKVLHFVYPSEVITSLHIYLSKIKKKLIWKNNFGTPLYYNDTPKFVGEGFCTQDKSHKVVGRRENQREHESIF